MKALKTLWAFSRPHTIIGSAVSITALFVLALLVAFPQQGGIRWFDFAGLYAKTLISALACNVFITGLNQLLDVEMDRINKPHLPIPAGLLSRRQAQWIIGVALCIAIGVAAITNRYLLGLIVIILVLGIAYSVPPLRFKRHHAAAAFSIVAVRGLLVNLGMAAQFLYGMTGNWRIPAEVWPLTIFIIGFSLAIAWFKDIPDTEGDLAFRIQTLAVTLSRKAAFRWGVFAVAVSYLVLMLLAWKLDLPVNPGFFYWAHILLLLLFLWGSSRVSLQNQSQVSRFYLAFWGFFFIEYIVYPFAFVLHG